MYVFFFCFLKAINKQNLY
uniref:Uncharacterized protein n=1 Tax=Arundo donax TaxID=35708 RepID=A0A0A9EXU7_ARUDO